MATILIVDDEADVRDALRELLELEGHSIWIAQDGADALIKAAQEQPDLIVMDLAMPRLDGLNATRLLRRGKDTAGSRVLLVSAHARLEDWPRLKALGFDGMLEKPVTSRDLIAEVDRLLLSGNGDEVALA